METLHIESERELQEAVHRVLHTLAAKAASKASVLALEGDLGAGKTAFTKALAYELGVTQEVTSPTFVIMKRYETKEGAPFATLYHIDAYRIEDIDEMRVLRFEEILAEKDTIICIEWAGKIEELLPQDTLFMSIQITGETSRTITFA